TISLAAIALYNLNDGLTLTSILVSLKIMTIAVFWFIANPTATHAIARSAYSSGIKPWTKDGILEVDLDEKRAKEQGQ
ncbi:MAG: monovalent cation/H(+) antiporter subunit G, partial [Thermodesulfovibrionales bacterium]|nr:monovalent cation/H(+) antiporter subunit G [Thermodesulfovibrionales bacterium]